MFCAGCLHICAGCTPIGFYWCSCALAFGRGVWWFDEVSIQGSVFRVEVPDLGSRQSVGFRTERRR